MTSKLRSYGKQDIDETDIASIKEVLESDFLTTGPKVKEFEDNFCEYIGCKHAVAVANGTAALDLCIQALELEKGSEIIVTPFTFMASSNCILYNGHKPVFCDIDKDTLNIDANKIEALITDKTKAIIYVDFGGRPCEIDKLKEIAKTHNLFLIEDACHAVGSEYKEKKVGTYADMTVFSFHPVKTMTTGEGGMITTNNVELDAKLRLLRNHGITKHPGKEFYEYDMIVLGQNYRITDIQCALGINQLKKLDAYIKKRQELVDEYNMLFSEVMHVKTPLSKRDMNSQHSWHLYYILLDGLDKNKFLNLMKEKGIGVHSFYIPIYRFSYYKNKFNLRNEDYPVAEKIFDSIVILPLFYKMNKEDVHEVVNTAKEVIEVIKNEQN